MNNYYVTKKKLKFENNLGFDLFKLFYYNKTKLFLNLVTKL